MAAMQNIDAQPMKIEARGEFTPPPVPCGGDQCRWDGFDVVHTDDCTDNVRSTTQEQ